MRYFTKLNGIINDCAVKQNAARDPAGREQADAKEELPEDAVRFLRGQNVTDVAVEASARLFITDEERLR